MDSDDDNLIAAPAPAISVAKAPRISKQHRPRPAATPMRQRTWPRAYLAATEVDDVLVIAGALVVSTAEFTDIELTETDTKQLMRLPSSLTRTTSIPH
jgi:hypothetical protein